ncbi:ATPase inhibitor mai-2, mitochondrial-like [Liolophura sinensis]|uniref:ATPase inhibitor mai-2, mitochondrial-like n=1 Tax=Liolophura sinensis TaxID=3198878 RepID=UPI00315956E8
MALRLRGVSAVFSQVRFMSGQWGEGAGKGGGSGGSIREAGGSFGKMEAAREEEYFRKLQSKQLEKLKDSIHDEIDFHTKQIKMHQDAISRHKRKIGKLEDQENDSD